MAHREVSRGPVREFDSSGELGLGYVAERYGKPDQKAPQAHAQKEAQEASQKDALAASDSGQISPLPTAQ